MTKLVAYQTQDMLNPYIWYGSITSYDGNHITLSNGNGMYGTYFGSFSYSAYGLAGGTVTGYESYKNGVLDYVASGGNFPALTIYNYLNSSGATSLQAYILSSNDEVIGSSGNDKLRSWNGDDTLTGGAGNDYMDGGTGIDTATYSQSQSNYSVVSISGGYQVAGVDGTDSLYNIEKIKFSNGTYSLSDIADKIFGTSSGDRLSGRSGNDSIDGGSGLDTFVYTGTYGSHTVTHQANGSFVVADSVSGRDGTDTVTNVERLEFSDLNIGLDTSMSGSSGKTALLIGAVLPGHLAFDSSKRELLGNVIELFDMGFSMDQLSGALMRLPIWDVLTGKSDPTNTDIANYLWTNVYGSGPTTSQLMTAVNTLNTEVGVDQGLWLSGLAQSAANQVHVDLVGIQDSGLIFY